MPRDYSVQEGAWDYESHQRQALNPCSLFLGKPAKPELPKKRDQKKVASAKVEKES